ncbi:MAG: hypothetical protein ACI4M5_00830 [Christensenellales bacterium]
MRLRLPRHSVPRNDKDIIAMTHCLVGVPTHFDGIGASKTRKGNFIEASVLASIRT